jgi:hypothetical protein
MLPINRAVFYSLFSDLIYVLPRKSAANKPKAPGGITTPKAL